ncbi:hypothetical protein [Actinoplanes sp. NPDC020271]|uniref:hypothetical protein n=1 Tax=Actinoplanes sp. NPDC020271 TaxID=3363896 RepID=UPI0037B99C5C
MVDVEVGVERVVDDQFGKDEGVNGSRDKVLDLYLGEDLGAFTADAESAPNLVERAAQDNAVVAAVADLSRGQQACGWRAGAHWFPAIGHWVPGAVISRSFLLKR